MGTSIFPSSQKQKKFPVRWGTAIALAVIVLIGIFLRFYHLGASGYGNDYYAAAVKSMLTSWHNFFFVSFEPGGSVSVDKPPLGFWIEAASAFVFGVNGFALALPNALAGLISILMVFYLVRKKFGDLPALIAALALATMPITVATERNNTIDGMLVCSLLLATWAMWKSVDERKVGYLFLSAVLMGLAFNIKMLQAFMVLPALYLLYLLGAHFKWGQRFLHLGLATVVLLAISFSWALIVDAVPAAERPFVGSSTNNTVMQLIFGHNGMERLENGGGMGGGMGGPGNFGPGGGGFGGRTRGDRLEQSDAQNAEGPEMNGFPGGGPSGMGEGPGGSTTEGSTGAAPEFGDDSIRTRDFGDREGGAGPMGMGNGQMAPGGGGGMGGGMGDTGNAGLPRLFTGSIAKQASWLLPLALIGILLFFLLQKRLQVSREQRLAVIFWAAWLVPCVLYFTFTLGLWHPYYLIMLGPAIAALVGITFDVLAKLNSAAELWGKVLVTVLSLAALGFELYLAYSEQEVFTTFALIVTGVWAISMVFYWMRPRNWSLLLVSLSLLIVPLFWSGMSVLNSRDDGNMPSAASSLEINLGGRGFGEQRTGERTSTKQVNEAGAQATTNSQQESLVTYLEANTQTNKYLLTVLSSREASSLILETSRSVLTLGGFGGGDEIFSVDEFAALVKAGEVRYVMSSGDSQGQEKIFTWVKKNCQVVEVPGEQSTTTTSLNGGGGPNAGMLNGTLYDCGSVD